jgi:hypothetical protein
MSTYCELEAGAGGAFDPAQVVARCIESGAYAVLADESSLPREFFDLSSGVAGELLHRMSVYGIKMAVVVADPSIYSQAFQAFAREANRGTLCRFFPDRGSAARWLESLE